VTSARGRIDIHNRVLLTLTTGGIVAVTVAGFVSYAPNRLISGHPIKLWEAASGPAAAGIGLLGAMLLAAAFMSPGKTLHYAQAGLAAALLLLVLAAAGQAASAMSIGAKPAVRISLGTAFWTLTACAALAIVDALQRLGAGAVARLLTAGAIVAGGGALVVAGAFDALSIAREYAGRRLLFTDALSRHVALVAGSVGLAIVIGFPLGVAAARSPRLQNPLFAVLNLLQTIPSIALFGLLIVPLSGLAAAVPQLAAVGVGGIGVAPAIVALVLYALLPVVRNTAVGLAGVDGAVIEAGRGMGLTSRQIFRQVEVPLALPVLLAGLRIVTVQAIGLAVVAALIGAGGLGTFVFEGLGQYAVDLVLLGALPAIFLALAADFILQSLSAVLRRQLAQ
jgi:osmoprotectant transport system permease protein